MKKFIVFLLLLLIGFIFNKTSSLNIQAQELQRVYFKIKAPAGFSSIVSYVHHEFGDQTFSIEAPAQVIERFKNNPNLEFKGEVTLWKISETITPNVSLPNIPEVPSLPTTPGILNLRDISSRTSRTPSCNPSVQIPWGVKRVNGGYGGNGVTVAVLDTGIKTDHPDLKNNLVDCRDAQYSSLLNRCSDKNGHGTHVAGTIAANGKILGVAPFSKIAAIQVCSSSGYCWSDDVARGIRYAADKGYKIINLSLGGSRISQIEKEAIDYAVSKGSLIIAAAGNDGPSIGSINYPAAYYKIVAVGAIQSNDVVPSFSSRGINSQTTPFIVEEKDIEFAAPGVSVESTYKDGCYAIGTGTSMATPHVSGLAAKLWQGSAQLTRDYLHQRANDIDIEGDDSDSGFGLPTAP